LESLVILGVPGKDCTTIIHMSVEDDKDVGVVRVGDLKLS
jgi:adenylate kinase